MPPCLLVDGFLPGVCHTFDAISEGKKINHATDFFGFAYNVSGKRLEQVSEGDSIFSFVCPQRSSASEESLLLQLLGGFS